MITQTHDTKEFVEPITSANKTQPTFSPFPKQDSLEVSSFAHKLKYKFISKQMKVAKAKLAEHSAPQTLLQVGDLYLFQNNYNRAISYFLMAIDLKEDFLPAYEKILFACLAKKDHAETEKFFIKFLTVTNRRPDILHKYGIFKALIDDVNQNTEEALSVLTEAIQKNPEDYETLNTYGLILLNLKNEVAKAKIYFNKSKEIKPDYVHPVNNLGVSLLREGSALEAKKMLLSAIKIDPDYVHSYQNLASAYISEENFNDALDILTKAKHRQLVLDNTWEHKMGWLLIQLQRFEEAIIWYKKKLTEEPKNDMLHNNLGVCYKSIGEHRLAYACFHRSVSLFKEKLSKAPGGKKTIIKQDQLKSAYNVGRSAIDNGNLQELFEISNFILELHPQNAFGMYLKGSYMGRTENYEGAKSLFKKALSLEPRIPEIYPDYSFILSSIDRDYDGAITILKESIALGFTSSLIENNLAHALILSDNLTEAEKILSKYDDTQLHPSLAATKGLLEFRKKNKTKGDFYYQKAVDAFDSKEYKDLATQIWHFEKALFAYKNDELDIAKHELQAGFNLPRSYINKNLEELSKKLQLLT